MVRARGAVRFPKEVRDGSYVPDSYLNEDGVRCCEYCMVGDHGRCWRVVCRCQHPGWTRDVNAQVPHGQASLGGEKGQYPEMHEHNWKTRKKGKNRAPTYNLPGLS